MVLIQVRADLSLERREVKDEDRLLNRQIAGKEGERMRERGERDRETESGGRETERMRESERQRKSP